MRFICIIFGVTNMNLLKDELNKCLSSSGLHIVPDYYGRSSGKMQDIRHVEPFAGYANQVIENRRTMLYYDRLYTIYQAIENVAVNYRDIERKPKFIEVGVYQGGGSYFMASVANDLIRQRAEVYSVDTFSGHSEKDLLADEDPNQKIGDFVATSYEDVKRFLSGFSLATVIQGRIQDCEEFFADMKLDLIHLDVDIYEPTYYALNYFSPRLRKHGIVIVDDYGFNTCAGVKKAVDRYLSECPDTYTRFELLTGQCLLVRKSN